MTIHGTRICAHNLECPACTKHGQQSNPSIHAQRGWDQSEGHSKDSLRRPHNWRPRNRVPRDWIQDPITTVGCIFLLSHVQANRGVPTRNRGGLYVDPQPMESP